MIENQHCYFLFHHTPPPYFGGNPLLLISEADGRVHVGTLEELSGIDLPIVTHSFSLLVDWLRNHALPLPKQVVDLEIAQKLLVGRPKSDFDVERPWDMPSMLRRFVHRRYDQTQVRASLTMHLAKPLISNFANLRWMTAIAVGLPVLWQEMQAELAAKTELNRFLDIEVPAYNAMLRVQYRGITLDPCRRESLLQSLDDDFVSSHHQLAIGNGIDVERALTDTQYLNGYLIHPIQNYEEFSDVDQIIEVRKESDRVCALLSTVANTRRNRSILLRSFGNEKDSCYPIFDTMGTVTGRILAVDPHLQHLSKKYRNIIQARAGCKLVYVDYSQFEPNIMAAISKDDRFLSLCSAGDIYERMSIDLCGDAKYRKTVKLMFLAYSYGKQLATLPDFLVEIQGTREKAESVINNRFVPLFAGIEKWKASIESELTKTGRIGTLFGNYRNRTKIGELDAKERRWAVSQVVQGTGALILKKLINKLAVELPEVAVLLPMHDALLVEVPENSASIAIAALLEYCCKSFNEVCPLVIPSVSEKNFFE